MNTGKDWCLEDMASHADQHDLDKLERWHRELKEGPHSSFPVYAIFVVSADDRAAHDVFRKFRTSFETAKAGFENLVIFGQHGISTTAQSLLSEFGLSQDALPVLALVEKKNPSSVYTLALPSGASEATPDEGPGGQDWEKALRLVEAATVEGNGSLSLDGFAGLTQNQMAHETLDTLVGRLLTDLA